MRVEFYKRDGGPAGAALRLAFGVGGGVLTAGFFLAIGLVRVLIGLGLGRHVTFHDLRPMLGWYVGGFAVAGAVIALLWPLGRKRAGRYGLGVLGAAFVIGAMFWALNGPPWSWTLGWLAGFLGLSVAFGLVAGVGFGSVEG